MNKKQSEKIKRIVAMVCAAIVALAFLASVILPAAMAATQSEIDAAKAKTEQQKKIAETYSKTMDGILEQVPDINLDAVSPEKAKKVIEETERKFASKMEKLREQAKAKGKGSVEYAQFRAYADFMKMCQTKRAMIEIRLKRQGGTLEDARARFKGSA